MHLIQVQEFFVFAVLLSKAFASIRKCPDDNITGCVCTTVENNKLNLICKFTNQDHFDSVISDFRGYEFNMFRLEDSDLTSITNEELKDISVSWLEIKQTTVVFFDLFSGLRGIRNLTTLIFDRFSVSHMKYTPEKEDFANLKEFFLLNCVEQEKEFAYYVTRYFPVNITSIIIIGCVVPVEEETFSFKRFENLQHLDISNNRLTIVKREVLPSPALSLLSYSLGWNPIIELPEDSFADMPLLQILDLSRTRLSTLPFDTFKPILPQLHRLKLLDLKFTCDCSNSWLLTKIDIWKDDKILCESPIRLHALRVDSLTPMEMCHPETYSKEELVEICRNEIEN